MSWLIKFIPISLFLFLLFSCAGDTYLFNDGSRIKLYKSEDSSSVSYHIKNWEKSLTSEKELFFRADITNIKDSFLFKILFADTSKVINAPSDNTEKSMLYFSVPEGELIQGFSIAADENEKPVINKIDRISFDDFVTGLKLENGVFHRSDLISGSFENGNYKFNIPEYMNTYSEIIMDFDYLSENHNSEKIYINITAFDGGKKLLEYAPIYGKNNIVLNFSLLNINPSVVEISAEKNTVAFYNFYKNTDSEYVNLQYSPIKAGFGSILLSDREMWRNKDFELFCWNIFPEFLIIDTSDYNYQANMFKRLAFYVEKPGSRGIIRTNEEIEDLHGWNAHDYKASDLASFFNDALKNDFKLNEEEVILRNILLANNVIKKDGDIYYPGNGGILSVSRESSGYLRRIFITHEGYHGIFFSSEIFRKRCKVVWDGIEPELKEFWKLFFKYKQYDTDDDYLLVNEFMAYNLQQPLNRLIPYYFDHIIPKLIKRYPDKEDFLNMILEQKKDDFILNADKLSNILNEVTSLPAGSLILLNEQRN